MAPIKTSVIGAGMALQMLHWPSIACLPEMFSLHSVMDRSGRSSEKVKELCGAGVKIVRTLEEVVRDPEVELVSSLLDLTIGGGGTHTPVGYTVSLIRCCAVYSVRTDLSRSWWPVRMPHTSGTSRRRSTLGSTVRPALLPPASFSPPRIRARPLRDDPVSDANGS